MRIFLITVASLLICSSAVAETPEELLAKEQKLLAEEAELLKKAETLAPTATATPTVTATTPPATATPTVTSTALPTSTATSAPTSVATSKAIVPTLAATIQPTLEPTTVVTVTPKQDFSKELEQAKAKIAKLIAELDETRSRLMIAETQVERLSSIVEKKANRDISVYSGSKKTINENPITNDGSDPTVAPHVLSNSNTPIATVIIEEANLRTAPGKSNPSLMKVDYGTRLAVETRQGEWFRVIAPTGARAWIEGSSIAFGKKGGSTSKPKQLSDEEAQDAEEQALQKLRNRAE